MTLKKMLSGIDMAGIVMSIMAVVAMTKEATT